MKNTKFKKLLNEVEIVQNEKEVEILNGSEILLTYDIQTQTTIYLANEVSIGDDVFKLTEGQKKELDELPFKDAHLCQAEAYDDRENGLYGFGY